MIDVVIAGCCGFMAGSFTTVLLIALLSAGREDEESKDMSEEDGNADKG